MPKPNARKASKSVHDNYEIPDEIDFSKTKFIAIGVEAFEREMAKRRISVELDADVVKAFGNPSAINQVLRAILDSLQPKKRKSA